MLHATKLDSSLPQALTPKQYACKFDTLALPTAKQIVKNSKHSSECINGSIQKFGRGGGVDF